MTAPLVVFPDPERVVIDRLVSAFAARSESYKPATVSTRFPAAALSGDVTHVQVELESVPGDDYPVVERAQVRVNCWAAADRRTTVKALASLALGLLCAHPGAAGVAGIQPRIGRSAVIEDPDTGYLMCWFLVRVNLLATQLAS